MISLRVNGEPYQFDTDCSIENALGVLGFRHNEVAVAINSEFVPRGEYAQTLLKEGDRVDVVAPVQGG